MRQHPDTFQAGNLITLEGPSGNTWRVRASDKPIIHSGWRAFSHDHDLREGDRLRFNLTHRSRFVVEVLDGNGEVKASALSATNTGKYTVASIANPCEYVRRPRKRKRTRTPRRSRDALGYGPTIASRCKTTARRRNSNDHPVRLRFSATTKQWGCHEETDGREVVTILDSDDDQADNHLLDRHIKLSFGSAQMQSYRTSKIQRLVQYMQTTPTTAEQSQNINHQANTNPKVEIQLKASRTDPALPCQAQGSGDESTMHNLEEDETHLIESNVEASLQPFTLPPTPEGEAADESHVTVGPLINQAPVSPSEELATLSNAPGGELLFATLQSIVDMHFLQPPKATVGHPRRHLEFKQFLNNATVTDSETGNLVPDGAHEKTQFLQEREICVLQSKRGKVANLDREKTLKAAQAWTKKLRNPNFVAVMKSSNVYHDFVMVSPVSMNSMNVCDLRV